MAALAWPFRCLRGVGARDSWPPRPRRGLPCTTWLPWSLGLQREAGSEPRAGVSQLPGVDGIASVSLFVRMNWPLSLRPFPTRFSLFRSGRPWPLRDLPLSPAEICMTLQRCCPWGFFKGVPGLPPAPSRTGTCWPGVWLGGACLLPWRKGWSPGFVAWNQEPAVPSRSPTGV